MFDVRFAKGLDADPDTYQDLVQEAVRRGYEHIAAHPVRALKGFSIEVLDGGRNLMFEVFFRRLGHSSARH